MEKKLDGNYTRMLQVILNKSWKKHPTKHQLYGHLPPITKTIKVRLTRHAGHCLRSRDKLISDVLLWTSSYGRAKAGRPARTYIQQLREDTGCSPEDLQKQLMIGRSEWWERVRDIPCKRHDMMIPFLILKVFIDFNLGAIHIQIKGYFLKEAHHKSSVPMLLSFMDKDNAFWLVMTHFICWMIYCISCCIYTFLCLSLRNTDQNVFLLNV